MQAVAYYRVSTTQQGESGLGLAAQKDVVMRFIGNDPLLAEFTEIESGKRHKNRPQLIAALELFKRKKARLVIAKLDRLSRNVAFIADLMESGVEFVCCDNPHATKLMLHMLAAFAQHERETISLRIREALGQVKADLEIHGTRTSKAGRVYTALGGPKLAEARAKAAAIRQILRPAANTMAFIIQLREQGASFRMIAAHLNSMDIRTPQGFRWHASSVRAALLRETTPYNNRDCAQTSHLQDREIGTTPSEMPFNAGRKAISEGGMPIPSDIREAERMLDLFTSVGARDFVVTKTDIEQNVIWGKRYPDINLYRAALKCLPDPVGAEMRS